jgi:hypothetical protein
MYSAAATKAAAATVGTHAASGTVAVGTVLYFICTRVCSLIRGVLDVSCHVFCLGLFRGLQIEVPKGIPNPGPAASTGRCVVMPGRLVCFYRLGCGDLHVWCTHTVIQHVACT